MFCGTHKMEQSKNNTPSMGHLLMPGMLVQLKVHNTGQHLKLAGDSGEVNAEGGAGEWAQWKVHQGEVNKKCIRLQNKKKSDRWLRITDNGDLNAQGGGGGMTEFIPIYHEPYKVSLKSFKNKEKGWHVGFNGSGKPKNGADSGSGKGSWLIFHPVHKLEKGMVVRLTCNNTGKNLKCKNEEGALGTDGNNGDKAKWKVEKGDGKYPHGTIKFRNVAFKGCYLRIENDSGKINAHGTGGGMTEFIPIYFEKNKVALRHYKNQKRHIGVNSEGKVKNGKKQESDGPDSWFHWKIVE